MNATQLAFATIALAFIDGVMFGALFVGWYVWREERQSE
jgi:hypothetical protein